jgi:hypothetical protein
VVTGVIVPLCAAGSLMAMEALRSAAYHLRYCSRTQILVFCWYFPTLKTIATVRPGI